MVAAQPSQNLPPLPRLRLLQFFRIQLPLRPPRSAPRLLPGSRS